MGTASSLSPGTPKRSPEAILHRVVGSSFSFVGSSFGCNGRVGGVVESRVQIGFGSVDGRDQISSRFVDGFFGGGFAAARGQTTGGSERTRDDSIGRETCRDRV